MWEVLKVVLKVKFFKRIDDLVLFIKREIVMNLLNLDVFEVKKVV